MNHHTVDHRVSDLPILVRLTLTVTVSLPHDNSIFHRHDIKTPHPSAPLRTGGAMVYPLQQLSPDVTTHLTHQIFQKVSCIRKLVISGSLTVGVSLLMSANFMDEVVV